VTSSIKVGLSLGEKGTTKVIVHTFCLRAQSTATDAPVSIKNEIILQATAPCALYPCHSTSPQPVNHPKQKILLDLYNQADHPTSLTCPRCANSLECVDRSAAVSEHQIHRGEYQDIWSAISSRHVGSGSQSVIAIGAVELDVGSRLCIRRL